MTLSEYTGPGELLLAPSVLGDITILRFTGSEQWRIGRDAFLAATSGIKKDYQAQNSIAKGMFSGEGFFIYKMTGTGLLWLQSFGAILKKEVRLPFSPVFFQVRLLTFQYLSSLWKENRIILIMVTWWPGTAIIR